ncbi:hypothetical protein D3875_08690 [Deinococcus cavernae]|uniref:ABC transporter permease n=1 Tax=Deinococcus cavernae TaxID=2320857 RepID=A0A418V6A9_9DEIO|nr:hypothetical protein [Deinococcus cavernae]RJF71634.1 hypothetical protein D3875_08690 [Deinococcus cavernae]
MRWLLLPLLLFALLAPRQECPQRAMVPRNPAVQNPAVQVDAVSLGGADLLTPPLRAGQRAAPLGTDRFGRDALCLNQRGLWRSLQIALSVLAFGWLPGVLLGLWLAWQRRLPPLSSEIIVLLALVLLLGKSAFRLVLVLGAALLTARLVAVRAASILRQPFVEGALALGGGSWQILRRHLLPHLWPSFPVIIATVLSALFLWLMELGALGFHDQPTLTVAFTDGLDLVQDIQALPLNADLGQLVSFFRWSWLDTPEQLVWPALFLTLLTLALKDFARWALHRAERSR